MMNSVRRALSSPPYRLSPLSLAVISLMSIAFFALANFAPVYQSGSY